MCVKVSIIVPVRNGAPFLEDCVRFIEAQTFTDYELIMVVDARSSDDTVRISQELSSHHDKLSVIVQNEGLKQGGNRNLGLKVAKGDYIWFVDVDDAPSPDFLKDMMSLQTQYNVDFVCCNFMNVGPKGVVKEKHNAVYHTKVMDHDEAQVSRNNDEFPVVVWCKLYNRKFLLDNSLFFDESFADDIIHTYKCLHVCTRICIYNRPLYAYRQVSNSICRDKKNLDNRGYGEIDSYDRADLLCNGDLETLRRNALMKMRSSGHMSYHTFMEYTKGPKNRESYEKYLRGNPEAWWNMHLSTLYWLAIRFYVATIYKRNGSLAMNKKFW